MTKGGRGANGGRLLAMSGREALTFGAIVSFRNDKGETWSWTRAGSVIEVIAEACDAALLRDPSYRIVAISTPSSIYTDLYGRAVGKVNGLIQNTELLLAAKARRKHMVHDDLRGAFSK